jgi:serine/threonine-protein kinase
MPLNNGEIFAGFRIIRLLGSGGMGEVYLVQHPRLPRRNALKVLPADVSADAEFRARFNREADLASTLYHPHIVGVHDRGEDNGQLWISMDYVEGLDAARLMVDRYPAGMPVDEVVRIVTAVASGLDYAHKQGLLHRDVKPANIMLTHLDDGEQRILLADFGIARDINDISGLTTTNMAVGTVAYSAPEQLMGEEIDGRADQYALAATAYHLLTGSQLFPHSNPAVVISRHLNTEPPALADTRPELAALDPVLAVALAKDPKDRFSRCADFARALAGTSSADGSPSPVAPTKPAPVPRPSTPVLPQSSAGQPPHRPAASGSPRRWLVPIAALAVILLAGVVALAWRPWESTRHSATTTSASSPTGVPPIQPPAPAPPPPPPVFPAKDIDSVLLTAPEMTRLLGMTVTNDTAAGRPVF